MTRSLSFFLSAIDHHYSAMSASNPSHYPEVILSNPEATSPLSNNPASSYSASSSSLYPSVEVKDLAENLFPAEEEAVLQTSPSLQPYEDVLVRVPGALVHLIEKDHSVELACGELEIVSLRQGANVVAVLARIGDDIQWPLAKDEAAVKLDEAHYFFTLRAPADGSVGNYEDGEDFECKECEMLNYGLTIASKGQEALLKELDRVLEMYSCFSEQKVGEFGGWEVLDGSVAKEMSPEELESKENKDLMGESSAAYWTTLAPNVEDYSGRVAKLIAAGSGQLIWGILWCGDVTVDRLRWGNDFLHKRMGQRSNAEISPAAMKRIKRFET